MRAYFRDIDFKPMLKMNKRGKDVNWSKFANASPKPKRLHLKRMTVMVFFTAQCKFVKKTTMGSLRKEAVENT